MPTDRSIVSTFFYICFSIYIFNLYFKYETEVFFQNCNHNLFVYFMFKYLKYKFIFLYLLKDIVAFPKDFILSTGRDNV